MEINIHQRLKGLREGRRLTQLKVATAINIKPKTYQAYEEGRGTPGIPTLIKLASFYGFHSIDILLGLEEFQQKEEQQLMQAYYSTEPEKRKIVDFILNLNC